MRFGNRRGVTLALALVSAIAAGSAGGARADWFHTIPREVVAVDANTGGPYFAPPIPYGHYAKDGLVDSATGCVGSLCGRLGGLLHGCCGGCGKKGCGHCGDGGCGHCGKGGLFGGHCGKGGGLCGKGDGLCGNGGGLCGNGGGLCGGGDPCGGAGCGRKHGLFHGHGDACGGGLCGGVASPLTSAQSVTPSPQVGCGQSGCLLKARHFHRLGKGCTLCNGSGCGLCQDPGMMSGSLCGGCHGSGCGLCGGRGLFGHGGDGCGACGGRGCGLCKGGHGCKACGGRGCGLCSGVHGLLGAPHALVAKLLHKGDIKWFVGPGGPVPLTPGYVPYVVATRSPRDYFAFPPFTP